MKPSLLLFLDDDRYEMLGLVERLESSNFRVRTFTDPNDAMEALRSGLRPDIIISDLIMRNRPSTTSSGSRYVGVDFCRVVREELNILCPIIVLTVVVAPAVHQEALKYAQVVLTKPVSPSDLTRRVRQVLNA